MKFRILSVFLLLLVDQVSKFVMEAVLIDKDSILLLPNILEFRYSQNTGMAFSLFADHYLILTICVSIFILGLIVYSIVQRSLPWALVFIIAGGLGNLADRFIHGYVIDFINFLFIDFAIFNVADIYLNIAAALIAWQLLERKKA